MAGDTCHVYKNWGTLEKTQFQLHRYSDGLWVHYNHSGISFTLGACQFSCWVAVRTANTILKFIRKGIRNKNIMQAHKNTSRQRITILASKKDAQKRQQAQERHGNYFVQLQISAWKRNSWEMRWRSVKFSSRRWVGDNCSVSPSARTMGRHMKAGGRFKANYKKSGSCLAGEAGVEFLDT